MEVVRAFIAMDLSPALLAKLEKKLGELKKALVGLPIRWVPVQNIHLTIKFLGDVPISNLEIIKRIQQVEAEKITAFDIQAGDLGAFPSTARPRVIWVGITAPQELKSFHRGIDVEAARYGYAKDDRDFSPHLTLGRVARNASAQEVRFIGEGLGRVQVGALGSSKVSEVHLYRSDLRPQGSIYTQLFTTRLREKEVNSGNA